MAGAWMAMMLLCKELSGYVIGMVNNWEVFTNYSTLPKTFPDSWSDIWNQMQYLCRLVQRTGDVLAGQNYSSWEMPVFVYGSATLAVRLGPVRHDLRATLAVTAVLVAAVALAGAISQDFRKFIEVDFWFMLTYIFGLLLLMLFGTLVISGVVKLVVIFANKGQGRTPKTSAAAEE
ncbi:MAG TPA: hypothetical protein PKK48_08385, partial [Phycisphaerae bacterium]|nr:hypothetical protein [Phycisphaerae bacterium]